MFTETQEILMWMMWGNVAVLSLTLLAYGRRLLTRDKWMRVEGLVR